MKTKQKAAVPWRMYLPVGCVGVIIAGMIAYSLYAGIQLDSRHIPRHEAIMQLMIEATAAHLTFEEIIGGDRTEEIDNVWDRLRRAESYARFMLEGGEIDAGTIIPLDDRQMREYTEFIGDGLARYKNFLHQRMVAYESLLPGSEIDQRSDSLFAAITETANVAEGEIQRMMAREFRRVRAIQITLMVLSLVLATLVGLLLHRHIRRRERDLLVIHRAKEDLEQDIAKRQRAEQALAESEEKYRNLVDRANDGIAIVQNGVFVFVSPGLARMLGHTVAEMIGCHFRDFVLPEELTKVVGFDRHRVAGEGVPAVYESALMHRDGKRIDVEHNVSITSYKGEKATLSIVRDITERKKTELALRREQERAQEYLDIAAVIFVVLDADGNISLINQKGCEVLESGKEDLIGKNWFENFLPENQRHEVLGVFRSLMAGEIDGVEYFKNPIITVSGKKRIISWHNRLLVDEAGNRIGSLSSGEDITERKQMEIALRQNEESMRALLDAAPDVIHLLDADGIVISTNQGFAGRVGKDVNEIVGRCIYDFHPPDSIPQRKAAVDRVFRTAEPIHIVDESTTGVYETHIHPVFDPEGKVNAIAVYARDITERKLADDALRESEEKWRSLAETSPDHIMNLDLEGNILFVNHIDPEFSWDQVIGRPIYDFISAQYHRPVKNCLQRVRQTGKPDSYETEYVDGDGVTKYFACSVGPIMREGRVTGYTVNARDITKRKRSEELIRIQRDLALSLGSAKNLEEGLQQCLNAAFQVSGMDCGGIYLRARNTGALGLAVHQGLSPDFIKNSAHYEEDSDRARLVIAGKPVYANYKGAGISLHKIHHAESLHAIAIIPMRDERDIIGCLNVASRNIDEVPQVTRDALEAVAAQIGSAVARLKTQEALRRSQQRLDLALKTAVMGIWDRNIQTGEVIRNELAANIYGYSLAEMEGNAGRWESRIHPDDKLKVIEARNKHLQGKTPLYACEYRLQHKSGEWRWIESRGKVVARDENGKPLRIMGTLLDITDRKKAEEALRAAHDKLELRVKERTLELSQTNEDLKREILVRKKIEKKLREHRGELQTLASELSLAEERERRRFAANLHDTISQNLVMAHMKLESLTTDVLPDEVLVSIRQANQMVAEALESTQTLTFELSPPVLHRLGLGPAIESLGDRIRQLHGLKVELVNQGPVKPLAEDLSAFLFRGTRELLINVVKHAKTKNAKVSIGKTRGNIKVVVEDHGVGFIPADVKSGYRRGVGFGLFSIQERLTHLGGLLKIWSEPGRGTRVTMSAPLKTAGRTAEETRI
ncbi:PAS domain S-box protein [Candidatus Zixiibacteriota bacterium]